MREKNIFIDKLVYEITRTATRRKGLGEPKFHGFLFTCGGVGDSTGLEVGSLEGASEDLTVGCLDGFMIGISDGTLVSFIIMMGGIKTTPEVAAATTAALSSSSSFRNNTANMVTNTSRRGSRMSRHLRFLFSLASFTGSASDSLYSLLSVFFALVDSEPLLVANRAPSLGSP